MAKQMHVSRYSKNSSDERLNESYKASFEEFKRQSKTWKRQVKTGEKTQEAFVDWLKAIKEKKGY